MNFFEKAQARADALDVLGLTGRPDLNDVRSAYKKLAFEKHPDRGAGTDDELSRINAAYTLLKDDQGYTASDMLRPAPDSTAGTTFRQEERGKETRRATAPVENDAASPQVSPRRMRSNMISRIVRINQTEASECRTLLDTVPYTADPEPDEISLRASIVDVIRKSGAPHVQHTNHLPHAIRQTGRRISYLVSEPIREGVNRVAVPTGLFSDTRKVLPEIVRFKSEKDGPGTHTVSAAALSESFPGAKSVRIHFGLEEWPD